MISWNRGIGCTIGSCNEQHSPHNMERRPRRGNKINLWDTQKKKVTIYTIKMTHFEN